MLYHAFGSPRAAPWLGFLLLAVSPVALAAQAPSPAQDAPPLQGVVIDEVSHQPIDSATVIILGTDVTAATGRLGSFAFPGLPPGLVSLHVSAPGRPSIVQEVEVKDDRIVFVQIRLPSVAAVLSELLVPGARRLDATETAQTAADLLAIEVPRTRVNSGIVGATDYQLSLRPGTTFQGIAAPLVLIDGVVASADDSTLDVLERIPASDVEEIQVLKGPAAAFLYPFAANGVINVVTKRGARNR